MYRKIELETTTPSVEGWKIDRYLGVATYQSVIGANIFSDLFAGFRDVFGGAVLGYQKELTRMEETALKNFRSKALNMGGNLILGIRMDFDEVSGGGKSMFMLSVSGTVAQGHRENSSKQHVDIEARTVNYEDLEVTLKRNDFYETIKDKKVICDDDIKSMITYGIVDIEKVTNALERLSPRVDRDLVKEYLIQVPEDSINEFILKHLSIGSVPIVTRTVSVGALRQRNWFNFEVLESLFDSPSHSSHVTALELLQCRSRQYSISDIENIDILISKVEQAFKLYPLIENKSRLIGPNRVWTCPNCSHKNSMDQTHCKKCYSNCYGMPSYRDTQESRISKITPEKTIKSLRALRSVLVDFFKERQLEDVRS